MTVERAGEGHAVLMEGPRAELGESESSRKRGLRSVWLSGHPTEDALRTTGNNEFIKVEAVAPWLVLLSG